MGSFGFPTISYGFPMDFLWIYYGFPMDFLWISYGCPMDFLWTSLRCCTRWFATLLPAAESIRARGGTLSDNGERKFGQGICTECASSPSSLHALNVHRCWLEPLTAISDTGLRRVRHPAEILRGSLCTWRVAGSPSVGL